MSLELFIPFLLATAILLATPGPTILLVVSHALERFPEATLWLALDASGGHSWLDPTSLAP